MKAGVRSFLFVPADDDRKVTRALGGSADAIILDLEDGVAPENKQAARENAVRVLSEPRSGTVIVRINGLDSPWFDDDFRVLSSALPAAVMLPKATAESLAAVADAPFDVIALIETARGVEDALAVASALPVRRLMLGSADLAAELGIQLTDDESELHYARSRVVMASAAASIEPPIDVVWLAVRDDEGLARSATRARALGFTAKACIHPSQVPVVNASYTADETQVERALAVVAAYGVAQSNNSAVTILDGRLVDLPVVLHAQRVLEQAAEH